MPLTWTLKTPFSLPIDLADITPARIEDSNLESIRRIPIYQGNQLVSIDDLFSLEGSPRDLQWHFEGDLSNVHGIGTMMHRGTIHIHGPAGRHLGCQMAAGTIRVDGDSGDWAGAEMHGGLIHIHGNAGAQVGGAYAGSQVGMTGGTILVDRCAGERVGARLRRGWICIGRDAGEWLGQRMQAGTIFVFGLCGRRPGANMRRGTLGLFGKHHGLLPTFRHGCTTRPSFFPLMARSLKAARFPADLTALAQPVDMHHGDFLESGQGEIFTR